MPTINPKDQPMLSRNQFLRTLDSETQPEIGAVITGIEMGYYDDIEPQRISQMLEHIEVPLTAGHVDHAGTLIELARTSLYNAAKAATTTGTMKPRHFQRLWRRLEGLQDRQREQAQQVLTQRRIEPVVEPERAFHNHLWVATGLAVASIGYFVLYQLVTLAAMLRF